MKLLPGTMFLAKPMMILLLALISQGSVFSGSGRAEQPAFSLPLNCKEGPTCFVQNRVDMDPGEARLDALCGRETYNGHKGTDIRVSTIEVLEKGIDILAMADGKVVALRNTSADRLIETRKHRQSVKGKECGNGAIIDHGIIGGKRWTTQYCHLKKGSVTVKKGDMIKQGTKIGQMGLSGYTAFPHIHVSIRAGKTLYDPFTGLPVSKTPTCSKSGHQPLLSKAALEELQESDSPVLDMGFTSTFVTKRDTLRRKPSPAKLRKPLIFYAHMKNLRKGDRIKLTIKRGEVIWMENFAKPLKVDKASYTSILGKRRGGKKGKPYTGTVSIIRDGKEWFVSPPSEVKF